MSDVTVRSLSEAAERQLEELKRIYPTTKSAVMPALYIAQEELGWISEEAVQWIAARLDLPPAHVYEVATFYTMYYKKEVGKYHLQICRTLSCMICGGKELTAHVKKRLGVKAGEITADGLWSWEEVECLGSCGTAPMIEINDVFFEGLTPSKLDTIMDRIAAERPNLRYSTVLQELGGGLSDHPRSQVWQARSLENHSGGETN